MVGSKNSFYYLNLQKTDMFFRKTQNPLTGFLKLGAKV